MNNYPPSHPCQWTAKEEQLLKDHKRLQELQAQIEYYNKDPYLVGMNSDGAFSFFFPESGHLAKKAKDGDCYEPSFDPTQQQLYEPPRYSFGEYFRTKFQQNEEKKEMEKEEKAAWEKLKDLRKEKKLNPANQAPLRNIRITLDKSTGAHFVVQGFDYVPFKPEDDPKLGQMIEVKTQMKIDRPHLTYPPFKK